MATYTQAASNEEKKTTELAEAEKSARRQARAEKVVTEQAMTTGQTALQPLLDAKSPKLTETEVTKLKPNQSQLISQKTGKIQGAAPSYTATTAQASQAGAANPLTAQQVTTAESAGQVGQVADQTQAVQGQVSQDAQAQAATKDPNSLAQLGLEAAQIDQAQTVQAPQDRTVQQGELIDGTGVDQSKIDAATAQTQAAAQTADPTKEATVQGQMENLMAQFEGGATPAWAAGAIRNAQAEMAARGLSSSSLAGQALVQAAMEAVS